MSAKYNRQIRHPLAEVFGFPTGNFSDLAKRHRKHRLCPYNNRVPSCTKDKASNPLGVCAIFEGAKKEIAITCPIRFRQDWIIAEDAASFFFEDGVNWTSLNEVRLLDQSGDVAGNIDLVFVSYDISGKVLDFGALEIQAVYISGNIRKPFEAYIKNAPTKFDMDWSKERNYPRPDYLSSSRKRLVPQLIYKGGILKSWNKKMAVVIHKNFYDTLPKPPKVDRHGADIAWLIYDLKYVSDLDRYQLIKTDVIYTLFRPSLEIITNANAGPLSEGSWRQEFIDHLQGKLDEKLEANPPDVHVLFDKEELT